MPEDSLNLKAKHKTNKKLQEALKKIESNREYRSFKVYQEEEVFDQSLLYLDAMFQQSKPPVSKVQDEDINSDEELIAKNQRESLNDLHNGIERFAAKKKVKDR